MSSLHRAGTALVSAALALSLVALAGGAEAASGPTPADHAGSWLSGQLTHGLIHNGQYDFDDYGLTADTAFALRAVGGQPQALRQIRHALSAHVDDYTTFQTDAYAGPTAKLLVLAQQTGGHARDFGGVNLVRRTVQRVSTTAPTRGRIEDRSSFGDNANAIGQIFAVRGLLEAGSPRAASALRFLLEQQCGRGFFRLDFNSDKTAAQQGCTPKSPPDTDVTALAVIELGAFRPHHAALRRALAGAVTWLQRHQSANGSFGGGPTTSAANSNSTGLAGWALGESGRCTAASAAATWISKRQVRGPLAGTPLAGQRGAIAYDGAAMRAAEKDGITKTTRDQWRRATAQAAPALRYLAGCGTR